MKIGGIGLVVKKLIKLLLLFACHLIFDPTMYSVIQFQFYDVS